MLPDRKAGTLAAWLCAHPGVEVVCRDGSASFEEISQGAPKAVQVSDRWHLRHGLGVAVEKTVIAHRTCWHSDRPTRRANAKAATKARSARALEQRTRARHRMVHDLLDQGAGLPECWADSGGRSTRSSATRASKTPSN